MVILDPGFPVLYAQWHYAQGPKGIIPYRKSIQGVKTLKG